MPLPIHALKPPYLVGRPPALLVLYMTAEKLAVALDQPPILQVRILHILQRHPLRSALDRSKQPVCVLAYHVVHAAVLLGAGQARGRLSDVNVGECFGGRVGRLRRGLVLGDGEGDGGVADGGADHVADALDREGGTGGLGELIILLEAATWSATEIEIRIDPRR